MSGAEIVQRRPLPMTDEARSLFLAALGEGFSVTHAAKLTGHGRQRMYELRDEDEDFAAAWSDAWEQGTDVLEDELRRRALGYDEVVYDGDGKVLRRTHKFDTPAIVATLKARRPELYRDNARIEVNQQQAVVTPQVVEDRSVRLSSVVGTLVKVGAATTALQLIHNSSVSLDELDAETVEELRAFAATMTPQEALRIGDPFGMGGGAVRRWSEEHPEEAAAATVEGVRRLTAQLDGARRSAVRLLPPGESDQ